MPGELDVAGRKVSHTCPKLPAIDPRNVPMKLQAQGLGGFKDRKVLNRGVEVKLVPRRAAFEAMVNIALQIGGEGPAPRRG